MLLTELKAFRIMKLIWPLVMKKKPIKMKIKKLKSERTCYEKLSKKIKL